MSSFKDELKKILNGELQIYKELSQITYEKTQPIIDNDTEFLDKTTMREEELILGITQWEKKREDLLNSWGLGKNTSMSQIISNITVEDKKELEDIKEELSKILEEIKERNELNNVLIRDSLEYLDFNINLLANVKDPGTYIKGSKSSNVNQSIFDRKV
jgi:flagellar biosynthesis/type III secretory pathway chaperone